MLVFKHRSVSFLFCRLGLFVFPFGFFFFFSTDLSLFFFSRLGLFVFPFGFVCFSIEVVVHGEEREKLVRTEINKKLNTHATVPV